MASIIKNRVVVSDEWNVIRSIKESTLLRASDLPIGKVIVPFSMWKLERDALVSMKMKDELGVWLAPDSEPDNITSDFNRISVIAVDFPQFLDGRGYSIARLLRERYGWIGELRAIGDILRDQLLYMWRCGFDVFEIRSDKNIFDALNAFSEFTDCYQASVNEPLPLFRRRCSNYVY
ncbi:MAG: DUF934 domain-containing protein [Burkholderia sp.]|nr:DUF934 domain-containing protein [Burkholderia sp.]